MPEFCPSLRHISNNANVSIEVLKDDLAAGKLKRDAASIATWLKQLPHWTPLADERMPQWDLREKRRQYIQLLTTPELQQAYLANSKPKLLTVQQIAQEFGVDATLVVKTAFGGMPTITTDDGALLIKRSVAHEFFGRHRRSRTRKPN